MILGKGSNTYSSQNEFENIEYKISTEACGYTTIISDATEELAALESALYVADIMLEEKALEGATEEEMDVLLEGVMGSVYTRLKEVLKKLIAKVKQWFANVKKFFQILFSHGKDFAKKYKTDIVKAAARCKGYKYKTYKFHGGWKNLMDMPQVTIVTGEIQSMINTAIADDLMAKNKNETSTPELVKIYCQNTLWRNKSYDSQTEYAKDFKEEMYGGDLEREEFEDFNKGPSVQDMLFVLENGQKTISAIEKYERAVTSQCDKTIRLIEKAETEAAKDLKDGESPSKRYAVATDICKVSANHVLSCTDIYKEAIKTASRDAESILKGLLRHRPAKESFEYFDESNEGESILESALRLI